MAAVHWLSNFGSCEHSFGGARQFVFELGFRRLSRRLASYLLLSFLFLGYLFVIAIVFFVGICSSDEQKKAFGKTDFIETFP